MTASTTRRAKRAPSEHPYEVRSSPIHGRGLFAARDIPARTSLGVAEGVRTMRNSRYVLWVYEDDGSVYGFKVTNDLRFANHARPGNAEFRGIELWTRRKIRAGDEITFDYGPEW